MQITYGYAKRVCKNFAIKYLGEYHDFYVLSSTLLLADVFDKFRNMCLEIYELHPEKSDSAPELAWEPSLKKSKVKLDLLTSIDMLLMLKKVSEEEYVILFIDIKKLITNN